MWKKTKEEQKNLDGQVKKFSVITALLSAGALTLVAVTMGYIYIKSWTPIKEFSAKKSAGGTVLELEFSAKVPVTGYVLYGTNPLATNKKEIVGEILGKAQMEIGHVLPERSHFVNFVTQTSDGKVFETGFLKVK
ncbi:MAG TPA: hypothetical protein ENN92_01610 [candidate division WWE3 bacterium]|uniref:Uncharacterized protein n=1 Tax=candidate division WWE3 bacterium TaxID=2053526 RepID=A0A7C1DGG0_UNCKA|nr:hypothetical protein [candidate division WWE3 bacterium]